MKLLFKALSRLQRLTAPGLAPMQPQLPSLTALDVSCPTLLPDSCILDDIIELTQLQELTLPTSAAALLATEEQLTKFGMCSQLSSLTFADHVGQFGNNYPISTSMACFVSCAEHLPALVSRVQQPEIVQQLQGLTALTKLHMGTIADGWEDGGIIMRAIGGMASLQSLQLCMRLHRWNPTEHGWLASQSLLTSVSVCVQGAPAVHFERVLSAVPQLSLLRSFQQSGSRFDCGPSLSSGPLGCLASASGTLELMQLNFMHLPANFMEVIQQLTHLSSLGIRGCRCRCTKGSFSGFSGLKAWTNAPWELVSSRLSRCCTRCG
jgi:hypothetical protein